MKKKLNMSALFMVIVIMINFIPVYKANAASIPTLQMVTQPKAEYKDGDRVSFTVTSPNYSGKVEYRVMLWNGTTKKSSELWSKAPGYYYKGWQPAGNYKFNINWPVKGMEPGAYSLTVLVRRVGAKVPYDSFVKTNAFWVKPKINIDPKFIGDGTEKRVSLIRVTYSKPYCSIYGWKNTKTYLTQNYNMDATTIKYEGSTNATIHDNLIYLSQFKIYPYISFNGKEYATLLGADCNIEYNVNRIYTKLKDKGALDGKPHNFEVYVYEVFYDIQKNEYYLANEKNEHWKGATAKDFEQKVGEMPKFVAIPVQIADF